MTQTITIPDKEHSIMCSNGIHVDVTLQDITIINGYKITYSYDYINSVYLPQIHPNTRGEILVAHMDRHATYDLGDPKLDNLKITVFVADKKLNFSKLVIEKVKIDCHLDDIVRGPLTFKSNQVPRWYPLRKIK